MQRFFVSAQLAIGRPIALTGDQAHQVRRVLRMRPGDRAILLDGRGNACEGVLTAIGEAEVQFQVTQRLATTGEPTVHITLYQAVLKGERFGWALQKGVEVGVSAFVPLIGERNVVDDATAVEAKRSRWLRIIQEVGAGYRNWHRRSGSIKRCSLSVRLSMARRCACSSGRASARRGCAPL